MITTDEIHNLHSSARTDNMIFNLIYYPTIKLGEFVGDMPSRDIAHAWDLMNVMVNRGYRPRITRVAEREWSCSMDLDEPVAYDESVPLVICKAALLSVLKRKNGTIRPAS